MGEAVAAEGLVRGIFLGQRVGDRMMKVARGECLTYKANRERGRHGWLRLTPAYSVYLVEGLVAKGDSVEVFD